MRRSHDKRVRILVAEDDPSMLESVSHAVAASDREVIRVSDGASLIQKVAEQPFDLIITDVSMPWMSGIQAAQAARSGGIGTPVIVMTALGDPRIESQARALPMTLFLRKPFELDQLQEAVTALLGGSA